MDCDEHIILKKLRDGDSEALDILPESHHGVWLLRCARFFFGKSWRHLPEAYPLETAIQFSRYTGRQSPQ